MSLIQHVAVLAMRPIVTGACRLTGLAVAEHAVDGVTRFLSDRFVDHSQRLTEALQRSNRHAWRSLEIALAGESLLTWLDRGEDRAFREQLRQFLTSCPSVGQPTMDPSLRIETLRELRAARKAGLLERGSFDPQEVARQCDALARHGDPSALLRAEWELLERIAEAVRGDAYFNLATYLALEPPNGESLLALAVRYYFRREVEDDPALFQGLAFEHLHQLTHRLDSGFSALQDALSTNADRLESLLDDVRTITMATHGQVLDLRAEIARQSQQLQDLGNAVLLALQSQQMDRRALRAADSMSLSNESELRAVQELVQRFRSLPSEQRRELPALLNAVGKLEVAAGDFESARRDFHDLSQSIGDPSARAEVEYNRYRACLELQQWGDALEAIREATRLEPSAYSPFPTSKFEPERILGAGGFGVAFLCRNRHSGARVVIKSLRLDGLDRAVSDVFREAQVLEELDHPAIVRVRDCDYADVDQSRPFIVMDYFAGGTLAEFIAANGPLPPDDLVPLARQIAEGLRAAHERGILHRDVKPANILVRREDDGWRVKIIDFGLALRHSIIHQSMASRSRSTLGGFPASVSGTLEYAAPEQLGRLPGVAVGPAADVYGFARTLCFALFRMTQPLRRHWGALPDRLADLVEQCLSETPSERPSGFAEVLDRLGDSSAKSTTAAPNSSTESKFWAAKPAAPSCTAKVFRCHRAPITKVCLSGDGQTMIAGGSDGSVILWSLSSGEELYCFEGHQKEITALVPFEHASGPRLFSASTDQTVREWDLTKQRPVRTFDRRTNRAFALSPRGDIAATGSVHDGMIIIWSVSNGQEQRRLKGHASWVLSLTFSPSGDSLLSVGADRTIRYWDVRTGNQLRSYTITENTHDIVFCSEHLAVSSGGDSLPRVWNLRRGNHQSSLAGHGAVVLCLSACLERKIVAFGCSDGTVRVWDPHSGQELQRFDGHENGVRSLTFAAEGSLLVSAGDDGTLRLWRLA